MSRTVTAHLFHALNGVVESPHLWQFDSFGDDEGTMMSEMISPVTDVVIGRQLWQEWAKYWPTAEDPFGAWINPVRKHVVSSTLSQDLPWNSVLVDGDPGGYLRKLRARGRRWDLCDRRDHYCVLDVSCRPDRRTDSDHAPSGSP